MTMEEALMIRQSVQVINYLMGAIPEQADPVSKVALTEFALSMAAELCVLTGESRFVLRMIKDILPRV